jgi:hypothetical protein
MDEVFRHFLQRVHSFFNKKCNEMSIDFLGINGIIPFEVSGANFFILPQKLAPLTFPLSKG